MLLSSRQPATRHRTMQRCVARVLDGKTSHDTTAVLPSNTRATQRGLASAQSQSHATSHNVTESSYDIILLCIYHVIAYNWPAPSRGCSAQSQGGCAHRTGSMCARTSCAHAEPARTSNPRAQKYLSRAPKLCGHRHCVRTLRAQWRITRIGAASGGVLLPCTDLACWARARARGGGSP